MNMKKPIRPNIGSNNCYYLLRTCASSSCVHIYVFTIAPNQIFKLYLYYSYYHFKAEETDIQQD